MGLGGCLFFWLPPISNGSWGFSCFWRVPQFRWVLHAPLAFSFVLCAFPICSVCFLCISNGSCTLDCFSPPPFRWKGLIVFPMSLAVIFFVIFFFSRNGLIAFQCVPTGNSASTYDHFELCPCSGMDYGRKSRHHCILWVSLVASSGNTCEHRGFFLDVFLLIFLILSDK